MAEILILGGGFGGLTCATTLAPAARAGHRVTLVERRSEFLMGLRKLWMLTGQGTREEGARSLEGVRRHGVQWVRDEIVGIEPARGRVRTARSEFPYDFLIVALGAEPRPDLVPGFEHVLNLYDADEVDRLAGGVVGFAGGRIIVGIFGLPYKCPPAPYEAAMLMEALFRRRGVRDRVTLQVFTPQPMSLPIAGPAACRALEDRLAEKRIAFAPNRKAQRIEPGRVIFEGEAWPFDLLIGVPPHRPPRVVRESALVRDGEWVRVDPATLRTQVENVFAVGDVTEIALPNGMALPKAGVFAEAQARVVSAGILHALGLGPAPAPFDGVGYCFIEVGEGKAAFLRGRFLVPPRPALEVSEPSAQTFEEKRRFERERLNAWL